MDAGAGWRGGGQVVLIEGYMVALVMTPSRSGEYYISKIRTFEKRGDYARIITKDTMLWNTPNKKRIQDWAQGLGINNVPFAGANSNGFTGRMSHIDFDVNAKAVKMPQQTSRSPSAPPMSPTCRRSTEARAASRQDRITLTMR